jgi:hypothetical protein
MQTLTVNGYEIAYLDVGGTWPPSDRPGLYRRCMRENAWGQMPITS